jgi:uncharacterized membrane protein
MNVARDYANGPSGGSRLRADRDLLLVMLLALSCGVVAAVVQTPAPRIVAGIALALALPGYSLTALAFPRRRLSSAERLLDSVGASLVVSALAGLLLDALPGHMGRTAWALLLTLVTILAALAASLWPAKAEPATADPVSPSLPTRWLERQFALLRRRTALVGNCLLGAVVLALVIWAGTVAHSAAQRATGFTELSAVPSSATGATRLLIYVESHEHRPTTFDLTVSEDGRVSSFVRLPIRPGERRRLTPPIRKSSRRVVVNLESESSSTPSLHVVYRPAAGRASTAR